MTFILPGENIVETKKCLISGKEFVVTDKDLEFLEKVSPVFGDKKYSIPSPKLSPEERQRRRLMFLNTLHFYNVKSSKSGKPILSIFGEERGFQVYHFDEWYAQDWDACDYGRKIDFSKTATENFHELLKIFPKRNIILGNGSENCEYVSGVGGSKNCYLISETSGATDCYFSNKVDNSEKCLDCSYCMNCNTCYECIECDNCYHCFYSRDCSNCRDSVGLRDCKNAIDCMFSSNVINKRFVFRNTQLTEEEYRKKQEELKNSLSQKTITKEQILRSIPQDIARNLHAKNNENSLGDYLTNTSDCFVCFSSSDCIECKYCTSLINDAKNCMDVDGVGNHIENVYESLTINKNCSQILFTHDAWNNCRDVYYSSTVKNSRNIFLSTGIIGKENCVMNQVYNKAEYESLCGKVIDHMKSTGEWGEFFPHELSPFGYNESMASEYFPMSEEEVRSRGWNWYDGETKNTYIGEHYHSLPIREYDEKSVGYEIAQKNIDELLAGILECEVTKKPFKIIKQELVFYIENGLPVPTKHPSIRHRERMSLRNPRKLLTRICNHCKKEIFTTYPATSPEKILCETCYNNVIY